MRIFGQTLTVGIIERSRGVVSAEVGVTRSKLSRRVCDWLDWRAANGKPKQVSSRKALLELERCGPWDLCHPSSASVKGRLSRSCGLPGESQEAGAS
jgi:hypothetical protein